MESRAELERVRWELQWLARAQLRAPLTVGDAARFERLAQRERDLLVEAAGAPAGGTTAGCEG